MASEIRVNTINNRSGLGTISITNSGAVFSGVTTFAQIKTTSGEVTVGTGASVFSPATNVLALGTNNTEKVRITSTGSVGIGTDNPTTKLVVQGDWVSSTGQLRIKPSSAGQTLSGFTLAGQDNTLLATVYAHSSSNFLSIQTNDASGSIRFSGPSSEYLRITSDGNVGINTDTDVSGKLNISGKSNLSTTYNDWSGDAIFIQSSSASSGQDTYGPGIVWTRHGTTNTRRSAVTSVQTGSDTDQVGLAFFTHPSSTASQPLVEKLRITHAGNVGIGLTNPQTALVVERDWVTNYGSINIKSSSDVLSGVGFRTDGGYAGGFIYRDGTTGNFFELNAQGSREIRALLNGSEALRIDSSGRLLVGANTTTGNQGDADLLVQGSTTQGELYLSRGGTPANSGGGLGFIAFTGGNGADAAFIRSYSDGGTWTNGSSHPSCLRFDTTADGASTPTERLRINASGAMGLGVVPEPQGSGFNSFQFGGLGNLIASSSQSAGGAIYLYNNTYRAAAGQWYRIVTDEATRYQALNGRHQFDVAPSGTADTIVSFAEKVRIDTDGLKFNGDTSADNALDDYEEGTWTPVFKGAATAGSYTLSVTEAGYTKIGRMVHLYCQFTISSIGSAGSAYAVIEGMPFDVGSQTIGSCSLSGVDIATAGTHYHVTRVSGATDHRLYFLVSQDNAGRYDLQVSEFSSGDAVMVNMMYTAA